MQVFFYVRFFLCLVLLFFWYFQCWLPVLGHVLKHVPRLVSKYVHDKHVPEHVLRPKKIIIFSGENNLTHKKLFFV